MSELVQDLRFALRVLKRSWGVTLVALLSFSVAIAGNTAVFGLIKSLLFQPLSVHEPERLVVLQERRVEQPAVLATLTTSLANHAAMAARSRTTSGWTALRPTVLGLRDGDRSEPITSAQVAVNFFDVMGIDMVRGRAFLDEEGVPGARKVAVVTPEFWERTRGGEGDPIGAVLTLSGEPVEVVGVMPEGFTFLFSAADIWVPLTESPSGSPRDRRDLLSMARLAPGSTMEQVQAELTEIAAALATEHPEVQRDWTVDAFNARFDIPDARTKIFYGLLQGAVFFVLLIACANITNLLLARAQERRREIALRTVLGAGRRRLVRQLLTESGILVVAGAALGLAFGWLGIRGMANHFAGLLPPNYTPTLDGTVVLFTVGLSVLAGLIFGLAPVGQTLRSSQAHVLKEGGGKSSAGRDRKLIARGLVVLEIALSLVALGGGGMLVRSFLEIQSADPGFDGAPLVTARLRVPDSRYPDEEQRLLLNEQILERSARLEGARADFVFNTLHSLMLLVREDPAAAERAIEDVATLIRYASIIQRRDIDAVSLMKELEVVRRYVDLERLRLDGRLEVSWSLDVDPAEVTIPAFALQTLVENAIKHGIEPSPAGGRVLVSARVTDRGLEIIVRDDGVGADPEGVTAASGHGLGLLRQRLESRYGPEGTLAWETRPGEGFCVTVRVPATRPADEPALDVIEGRHAPGAKVTV